MSTADRAAKQNVPEEHHVSLPVNVAALSGAFALILCGFLPYFPVHFTTVR